jgi:hypothetical protein
MNINISGLFPIQKVSYVINKKEEICYLRKEKKNQLFLYEF